MIKEDFDPLVPKHMRRKFREVFENTLGRKNANVIHLRPEKPHPFYERHTFNNAGEDEKWVMTVHIGPTHKRLKGYDFVVLAKLTRESSADYRVCVKELPVGSLTAQIRRTRKDLRIMAENEMAFVLQAKANAEARIAELHQELGVPDTDKTAWEHLLSESV